MMDGLRGDVRVLDGKTALDETELIAADVQGVSELECVVEHAVLLVDGWTRRAVERPRCPIARREAMCSSEGHHKVNRSEQGDVILGVIR